MAGHTEAVPWRHQLSPMALASRERLQAMVLVLKEEFGAAIGKRFRRRWSSAVSLQSDMSI